MLIGVISDTHDNVENVKEAVEVFKKKKVSAVIHCGDFVAPVTVPFFKGLKLHAVKGNCDGAELLIKELLEKIGGKYHGDLCALEVDGKKIAAYHGTSPFILDAIIRSKDFDIVVHGHTHKRKLEVVDGVLVVNPGAHYPTVEAKSQSIAIIDLKDCDVDFIRMGK